MKIQHKNTISKKRIATITGIALLVIGIGGGALYYYRVFLPQQAKDTYGSEKTKPQENQPESQSTKQGDSTSISSSKDDTPNTDQPVSPPDASVTPSKPVGVFVSNHSPNLSGTPAPNTMNSTCSTTAGATCVIEFKQGSVVKSLEAKKTDSNGNVTWNWKLQDIGLTQGTWKITAIAKNGSLSATSIDPADLEVAQ